MNVAEFLGVVAEVADGLVDIRYARWGARMSAQCLSIKLEMPLYGLIFKSVAATRSGKVVGVPRRLDELVLVWLGGPGGRGAGGWTGRSL